MQFETFKDALAAAQAAYQSKDLETAAEIYRSLPAAYPDKKHAVVRAADGLRLCGYWSEGVGLLLEALERWPISPLYLTHLAYAYADIGESAKAAEYLQRSLDRDLNQPPQTWKYLGSLYANAGDFERAAASYSRMLATEPLDVEAIMRRADAWFSLQRFEDALADYRRADAIQPGNAETLFKLGTLALEYGSTREAVDHLQRAIAANPRDPATYANLSLALSVLGLFEDAARTAALGLDIGTTSVGQFALGTALIGSEQYDAAADALRSAAAGAPRNTPILAALAEAETGRQDYFAAERALQQVLSVDPENARARFMLSALHGEALDDMPLEVAASMFDLTAARYDQAAARRRYQAPIMAAELLEETLPDLGAIARVLDLGCGTGLVIAALRDAFRIESAVGIDIAERMIDIAAQKNLYDRLIVGEAVQTMEQLGEQFDLITAVELAPYLGNLSALFSAARAHLAVGGLFLCSVECSSGSSRELKRNGRFAHNAASIEDLAREAGFEQLANRELPLHQSRGEETRGAILLFRRS